MEWVKLIQTALDYMEAHLLEKISYDDVAREIHMSSYNFHRTFSLSGYEQTDETDFEIYYEKGAPGLFCELWIPVTVRRRM